MSNGKNKGAHVDQTQASKELYMAIRALKMRAAQIDRHAGDLLVAHQHDQTLMDRVGFKDINTLSEDMRSIETRISDLAFKIHDT